MPRKRGGARNVIVAGSEPRDKTDNMNTNIIRKLAGIVALLSGGSLSSGAVIAKRRAPYGGALASVFVTNGGYNGVQQALRLWKPHGRSRIGPNCD
jgi:hypothetical protein